MIENAIKRFMNYSTINTQAKEGSQKTPSSEGQIKLAEIVCEEMKQFGLKTSISEHGYVYGFLKGNTSHKEAIGFIAHLDTAPGVSGENVKAHRFVYEGGDIRDENGKLRLAHTPELERLKGREIIMSDGNTLLGADNKAGIAIIMTAIEKLRATDNTNLAMYGWPADEEIAPTCSQI